MTKLVFFLGPAGAGKTTIAKNLARKRRAAYLDMDTLLRPAAEAIMTLSGLDPNDRDSAVYKKHCRDLGYRITMDTALENLELGVDAFVVGPFTKETEDPFWLEKELSRMGAAHSVIDAKVVYVFLPDSDAYKQRIQERGSALDDWKLENWSNFSLSLTRREVKWTLPEASILYFDNSGLLSEEKLTLIERYIDGS